MTRHTHHVAWTTWVGVIVVAAVILGGINFLQTGNPLKFSIASVNTQTTASFSGSCPAVPTAGYPKILVQGFVVNQTTGLPFQAATTTNVLYKNSVVGQG